MCDSINIKGLFAKFVFALIFISCFIQPLQAADLPDNVLSDAYHVDIRTANSGGFYIKFDGGGLNALHITTSTSEPYGQVTSTSSNSGTFYISDTGGRGFFNDMVLMVAIKKPDEDESLPDNLKIKIKSSGFKWTSTGVKNKPPELSDVKYVEGAVDTTFGVNSFLYGPQKWKPAGLNSPKNYPIYYSQDISDEDDLFYFFFVDLKVGNLGSNSGINSLLENEGMIEVKYSIENINSTMISFNSYGWCDENQANQGKGISWTNALIGDSPSGYTVIIENSGSGEGGKSGSIDYGSSDSDPYHDLPKVGNLNITSVPSGAKVYLDGNFLGEVTNASFTDLPAGDYGVRLELENYDITETKWIKVKAGYVTEENFELVLSKSSCYVESVPKGADIFLDGNDTLWHTNSEIRGIDVGNHTMTVSKPGFGAVSQNITIEKDKTARISVILEPDGAADNRTSGEAGNEFYSDYELPKGITGAINESPTEDGRLSSYSNAANMSDESGSGNLNADNDFIGNILPFLNSLIFGEKTDNNPVSVSPVEKTSVLAKDLINTTIPEQNVQVIQNNTDLLPKFNISQKAGSVYVNSVPDNLPIYFDGKESGYTTPHFFYGIKDGMHKVGVKTTGETPKTVEENIWLLDDDDVIVNFNTIVNGGKANTIFTSKEFRNQKFKIEDKDPEYSFPAQLYVNIVGTYVTVMDDGKYYSFNPGILADGDSVRVLKNTNFGKISIDSEPQGAEIYVNGYDTEKTTPAVLDTLSEGHHIIQVSKDGYYSEKKEVVLVNSKTDIDADIKFIMTEYAYGVLSVDSQPEGCSIYIRNSYTGKNTPYVFNYIPIGTYDLMVMYNRTVTEKKEVTITPFDKKGIVYSNFTFDDVV